MKKSILLFCFLGLFSCKQEPGQIHGVVTYFFNYNLGYKPDIGSEIYVTKLNCDSLILYYKICDERTKIYRDDYKKYYYQPNNYLSLNKFLLTLEIKTKIVQDYVNNRFKKPYDYDKFLITSITTLLDSIKNSNDTYKALVDVSGNYNISQASPGDYNILIFSSVRRHQLIKKIKVKSNELTTVNSKFEL